MLARLFWNYFSYLGRVSNLLSSSSHNNYGGKINNRGGAFSSLSLLPNSWVLPCYFSLWNFPYETFLLVLVDKIRSDVFR